MSQQETILFWIARCKSFIAQPSSEERIIEVIVNRHRFFCSVQSVGSDYCVVMVKRKSGDGGKQAPKFKVAKKEDVEEKTGFFEPHIAKFDAWLFLGCNFQL